MICGNERTIQWPIISYFSTAWQPISYLFAYLTASIPRTRTPRAPSYTSSALICIITKDLFSYLNLFLFWELKHLIAEHVAEIRLHLERAGSFLDDVKGICGWTVKTPHSAAVARKVVDGYILPEG